MDEVVNAWHRVCSTSRCNTFQVKVTPSLEGRSPPQRSHINFLLVGFEFHHCVRRINTRAAVNLLLVLSLLLYLYRAGPWFFPSFSYFFFSCFFVHHSHPFHVPELRWFGNIKTRLCGESRISCHTGFTVVKSSPLRFYQLF